MVVAMVLASHRCSPPGVRARRCDPQGQASTSPSAPQPALYSHRPHGLTAASVSAVWEVLSSCLLGTLLLELGGSEPPDPCRVQAAYSEA